VIGMESPRREAPTCFMVEPALRRYGRDEPALPEFAAGLLAGLV